MPKIVVIGGGWAGVAAAVAAAKLGAEVELAEPLTCCWVQVWPAASCAATGAGQLLKS